MGRRANNLINNETIYELKEQGLSYKEIRNYFLKIRIDISEKTIIERCAIIYAQKGKKSPHAKRRKSKERKPVLSMDMLKMLKKKGMSDREVAHYCIKRGIRISPNMVCKLYSGIEEQRAKESQNGNAVPHGNAIAGVSDDKIYELKEQRLSNEAISEYYKSSGISISRAAIERRVRIIYAKLGKKAPRGRNKDKLKSLDKKAANLAVEKIKSSNLLKEYETLEANLNKTHELEK